MEILYSDSARKDLENLPKEIQKRIANKMRFFAGQNDPLKFAKRLTDHYLGQHRFRIGDYRVVFDVIDSRIFVLKIAKRDEVYE